MRALAPNLLLHLHHHLAVVHKMYHFGEYQNNTWLTKLEGLSITNIYIFYIEGSFVGE